MLCCNDILVLVKIWTMEFSKTGINPEHRFLQISWLKRFCYLLLPRLIFGMYNLAYQGSQFYMVSSCLVLHNSSQAYVGSYVEPNIVMDESNIITVDIKNRYKMHIVDSKVVNKNVILTSIKEKPKKSNMEDTGFFTTNNISTSQDLSMEFASRILQVAVLS